MKHNFLTGAFSLIAVGLGLSGCSSDDLMSDISTPVEKDTSFYINVQIASPTENSTRANDNNSAEDYENGTDGENTIHKILFVFYNSSMQYVGNTEITPPAGGVTTIPNPDDPNGKPGSIESVVKITVPVDVPAGSLKPAYVMAYVNPTVGTSDQQRSFEQTLGLTRTLDQMIDGSGDNAHAGFTMTNSVYYESNTATAPTIAVPISADQLFTSKDLADAAVDETNPAKEKTIKIYVERVVAKVNLKQTLTEESLKQTNNQISTDAETPEVYTLDFEVLGWGLSNLEQRTFLVKNFRADTYGNCVNFDTPFTLKNMSYSDANTAFSFPNTPAWNMPGNTSGSTDDYWPISGHRSFWAMSPTYFPGGIYPSYADEAKEKNNSSLEYITFDDIYDTTKQTPALGNRGKEVTTTGNYLYTLENTAQAEVVTNNQKRAVTCALIVGKYTIKDADGNEYNNTTGSKDFFIRQGLNADGTSVSFLYPDETEMKKAFLAQNNTILLRTDNGEEAETRYTYTPVRGTEHHGDDENNTYLADFQIYHPGKTATDGNYTPNRFVTLKLAPAKGSAHEYYYYDTNGNPVKIGEDTNLEAANAALYHNLNSVMPGVEKYKSGYAYFSVPIKHLWTKDNTDTAFSEIGADSFEAKTGMYGIVRNHVYSINVTGIEGIGTGIGDPSVPIIPNVETDKYFVRTEMRVQRWRVVPQQNVILRP